MMRVNQYRPDFAIVRNGTPFITGGTWRRNIIHIRVCTRWWERGRECWRRELLSHGTAGAKGPALKGRLDPEMRNYSPFTQPH